MKLNIFETPKEVLEKLATYIEISAQEAIASHGRFVVSLSGGSSPKALYELLASRYANKIDWQKVYFFFGDERYVPHDDPDSNYLMVKQALFTPLKIAETQIFAVDTNEQPVIAAQKYAEIIKDFFTPQEPRFDLILLGLGDNSHTASLFPNTPVLHEQEASVREVFLEDQKVYRITFTAPLINLGYRIAFLVYGKGKAEAVHHVIEGEEDINVFPAQLIKPVQGEVLWFLDKGAASRLSTQNR